MIEKTSIRASHIFTFLYHVIMCASIFPAKKNFMELCERIFNDIRDTIRKPYPGNISNDKRQNIRITVAFILPIKKNNLFLENFRSKLRRSVIDEIIISMERSIWICRGVSRIKILPQFGWEFHEETSWLVSKTTNRGETGVDDKRCSTGV